MTPNHDQPSDYAARASSVSIHSQMPPHRLFDEDYPEHERIPRLMDVVITTDTAGRANTTINGDIFGTALTDNRRHDDGYRYHDVFHVAHAALLGWSPTLRGLLRRKRKSDPIMDEVEDGGRAIVIDEGLTALIFSHAEAHQFYENSHHVDAALIATIQTMTSHLEVSVRRLEDWQQAILQGYAAWRYIHAHQGGRIRADLTSRTIHIVDQTPTHHITETRPT